MTETAVDPAAPARVPARPARQGFLAPVRRIVAAVGPPALAGAVTGLGFAPAGFVPATPVGIGLGLALMARKASRRGAMLAGVAYAIGMFAVVLSFMLRFGVIAWAAFVAVQALPFAFVGWAAYRRRSGRARWMAGVTAGWVLAEALRARWPLGGAEWGQAGYVWPAAPWRGVAALGGVLALTALMVGACAAVVAVLAVPRCPGRPRRRSATALAVLAAAALATAAAVTWTVPAGALDVAIVQVDPVCDGPAVLCPDEDARLLAAHAAATGSVREPVDLLVWGEGALGGRDLEQVGREVARVTGELPAPLLAGVTTPSSPGRWRNWNALFAPDGQILGSYAKRHPVPFGEYVPARELLGGIGDVGRLVPADLEPGAQPGRLPVGAALLGTVSSWEVTFARETRVAGRETQAVVALTTVSSYGDRQAVSDQQLAMARIRAVELGKPVVVAATTGRSAIIDTDGTLSAATSFGSEAVLPSRLELRSGATPYARGGDLPLAAAAGVALVWAVSMPALARATGNLGTGSRASTRGGGSGGQAGR